MCSFYIVEGDFLDKFATKIDAVSFGLWKEKVNPFSSDNFFKLLRGYWRIVWAKFEVF